MNMTAWILTGKKSGSPMFWQSWTGASRRGRPKWVGKLSLACLYHRRGDLEKILAGKGSTHFQELDEMEIREVHVNVLDN